MEKLWTECWRFYLANQDLVVGIGIIVFLVFLTLPTWRPRLRLVEDWVWMNVIPKRRGKTMRKARREFVVRDAMDGFTDFIETRVYHEGWSRDEAKAIYQMLKRAFPKARDIFPNPELLKEQIKKRRASGINDPVKLPDGKWKQAVSVVKKRMFAKRSA